MREREGEGVRERVREREGEKDSAVEKKEESRRPDWNDSLSWKSSFVSVPISFPNSARGAAFSNQAALTMTARDETACRGAARREEGEEEEEEDGEERTRRSAKRVLLRC